MREGREEGRRNSGIKEDELMTMCCCEAEEIEGIPVIFAVEVGLKSSSEFPQASPRNLVGNVQQIAAYR